MDKRILILIAVALLVIVGIWLWTRPVEPELPVEIPDLEREVGLKTAVGYGVLSEDVSYERKEEIVVKEAFDRMKMELGEDPQFVILTSSVGFDQERILQEAKAILPEDTRVYGYTTMLGLMTNHGLMTGEGMEEGGVLGMMGFAGESLVVGVGGASLTERELPEELSKLALERAFSDAERDIDPKVVMLASVPFGAHQSGEYLFVEGMQDIIGTEVPIAGGGAVGGYSDLVSGGEAVFANDTVYEEGIAVVVFYTDTKIGHAFLGGFNPAGPTGEVTEIVREEEVRLISIDNQPAAQVYNEWLGGQLRDFLGTSEQFLHVSLANTLGVKMVEEDGTENWHMIVAFNFNPDGSITLGTMIPEGSEIHLLKTDPASIMERPSLTVRLARGRAGIPERDVAGVLLDQCIGGLLLTDEGEWGTTIEKAVEASGHAPFMGVSNLGPYGHFAGIGGRYGEVTPSVLVFGKY